MKPARKLTLIRVSQAQKSQFIDPQEGHLLYLTIRGTGNTKGRKGADLAERVILAAQSVIKTRETSS